jgi:hypothetical protein
MLNIFRTTFQARSSLSLTHQALYPMQNPLLLPDISCLTHSSVDLSSQLIVVTPSLARMAMTVGLGLVVLLPSNVLLNQSLRQ